MRATTSRLTLGTLLLLLPGCAASPQGAATAPAADAERDLQARCVHTGGIWHGSALREGFCEYQSPGMI